ncbi:MAG: citramalate synthase [Deltaproteobacteria bacterium]|nr:citramalate synthase [Deltaproteobacteria bacterium]
MNNADLTIYDTTLRDGAQREGISLAVSDKLRIAEQLDALGIAFVECGWPGSNPKDAELFQRARNMDWHRTTLVAFGATRRAGLAPEDDPNLAALIDSRARACTIFGKTSLTHVQQVLRTTPDENLVMIEDSVRYLAANGRRVIYDAEHFFDGAREDLAYAIATLEAAVRGGAEAVVLCDTNGGTLPWEVEERVRLVRAELATPIGIHAHDDGGLAVANSLAAVRGGATHVQGTINGYGERCGNANLTTLIPDLEIKLGRRCIRPGTLVDLGRVARFVAEIANLAFDEHAPYFGRSAFAHKGGVHVAAVRRAPHSYEHIEPERVGNRTRFIVSELSGRANVEAFAEEHGLATADVLATVKAREHEGYAFESAEAAVALMMRRSEPAYAPPFELVDYKVMLGNGYADAAVKVRVAGNLVHTAAEGNGPVSALDAALRKALAAVYPEIEAIHLEDYKVRIIDGRDGTNAVTRVLVDHGFRKTSARWTTVGASPSIVEASLVALVDGIEHGLWLARGPRKESDEGHDRLATG